MPPKKRKRKQPTQSQSQKVIVNIGSKSAPRKKSGRGGLPPPSHMHNLAPTFVTSPQVDYTPLLLAITQQTRSLQPEPVRNPVTPLSSTTQPAEQMAGEAAQRRAGPTAANFQPPPSESDERFAREEQFYRDLTAATREREKLYAAGGGGEPLASSRDVPLAEAVPVSGKPAKNLPRAELLEDDIVFQGLPSTQPSTGFQSQQNPTGELGPKTPKRQQQQAAEKTDIKNIIDQKLLSGEPLTQEEMSRARLPSSQIGKTRVKRLKDAGYPIDVE